MQVSGVLNNRQGLRVKPGWVKQNKPLQIFTSNGSQNESHVGDCSSGLLDKR